MTVLTAISVSTNQPTLQELVDRVMARNQWTSARTAVQPKVESFQSRDSAGDLPAIAERLWHR